MPLETATKISELNDTNPVGASDAPSALDDHIRLIKTVLKADAASLASGAGSYVATVGGTADAITLTPSPAITAYAAGLAYSWIASGANTGAVTINVSGLGAKAARKNGTTALAANDIPSGALMRATYDGTNFQVAIVADRAALGVTAGTAVQVDQAVTATTRAATTTLGTSLNHTLSDTSTTITAFNGVAGVTYSCLTLGVGSITHSANLIITQGLATLTTAAGMTFDVEMITGTTCRIKNVMRPDNTAVAAIANALASATTTVNVSSATAPSTGQVLKATSSTAATWQAEGGGLRSVDIQTYNSGTGIWTKPTVADQTKAFAKIEVIGGGSAGGSRATTGNAAGGKGGGWSDLWVRLDLLAATENYVVGASAAGVSGNATGTSSNISSFTINGVTYATGVGAGGANVALGTSATSGGGGSGLGARGTGTVMDGITNRGGAGGVTTLDVPNAAESPYIYAPGGGGACSSAAGGTRTGGLSVHNGRGGDGGANTGGNGTAGTAPGGGGGAAVQGGTSGAGAAGRVRITTYSE